MSFNREKIVNIAREWIGTPYHHQAYVKQIGADCLGLLRGIFIELYGYDPEKPPRYSPAWGEADTKELLLTAAKKYLNLPNYHGWKMGDVLIFRVFNAASAKHCAIVSDYNKMIHALSQNAVLETGIGMWTKRIAGVFSFPGVK